MEIRYHSAVGSGLEDRLASTAGMDSVKGILLLTTPDQELLSAEFETALRELEVPIFGGVFPELLYDGDKRDHGALIVGLSSEPLVTTVPELSDSERSFRTSLDPDLPARGYETAFVFVDAHADEVEAFIEALFRTYSVELNFIGGGAGTLDKDQQPCLFTNDGVIEDAAVVATLSEPMEIGVKHGWQKIDGPFRVTDADGSRLETLDGKPALDVYRAVIADHAGETVTAENFFQIAKSYPFGLSRMAAEEIVRDPFAVADDGSISCFGEIPEGEFVTVLEGNSDSLVDAARTAYDHALSGKKRPDGLCIFDCISRVLFLKDKFDRELAAVTAGDLPTFGALTIGEIANDGAGHLDYYNKTAVVGTLRET